MTCDPNISKLGTDYSTGRKKQKFDTFEEQTIEKFADYMAKVKAANGDVFADAAKQQLAEDARTSAEWEAKLASHMGDMIALDPKQSDHVGSFFARMFGEKDDVVRGFFTGNIELSTGGAVREALLEAKRVATNAIQMVGLWEKTDRIDSFMKNLNEATGGKLGAGQLHELYQAFTEVGKTAQDLSIYGNTPGMQTFSAWRIANFQKTIAEANIAPAVVDDLVNHAASIASAYDEMRAIAMSQGIDVKKLQGMGYLPRIPTDDFRMFIQASTEPSILEEVKQGKVSLSGAFAKSRNTYWYMPVHEELGAAMLGTSPKELNQLLQDPVKFRNFLHENVTAEQLDTLVDSGMFRKLPMTGAEAFRYVVDQYQLPFKSINQMWKIDPKEAMEAAAKSYERAVGNAAIIKTAVKDGLDAGWAIPRGNATAEHASWVSTKGLNLDRYGIDVNGTPLGQDLLVHPMVAANMRALMKMSADPSALGQVASYINGAFNTLFKVNRISTAPAYLSKIFLQNAQSLIAMEVNPAGMLPAYYDMMRIGDKGLSAFDNVKILGTIDGEEVTVQGALKKLLLHRGEDVAPESSGISTGRIDWSHFNPTNAKRAMTNLLAYANAYGQDPLGKVLKAGEYSKYLAENLMNAAYAGVAVPSRMADMGARWAFVQSELAKGPVVWEQVARKMDNHFFMYDDLGTMGEGLARYAFPASSWMIKNLPAMARFMLREPHKFIAYHRLIQTINQQPGANVPNNIEANYTDRYLESYPISMGYDPVSKTQFSIIPGAYDPLADSFSNFVSSGNALDRILFGHYNGTTGQQTTLATKGQGGAAQEYMRGLVERSYFAPFVEGLGFNLQTGKEATTDTGFETKTLFGKPISGVVRGALMMIPPVKHLENSGLMGNTPDSQYYQAQQRLPFWMRAANTMGAGFQAVDTLTNLNYNYKDMKAAQREMLTTLKGYSMKKAGDGTPMTPKDEEMYSHYADTYVQLTMDLARLDHYKAVNNITTPDLEKQLQQKVIKAKVEAGQLPLPGGDILTKALKDAGLPTTTRGK